MSLIRERVINNPDWWKDQIGRTLVAVVEVEDPVIGETRGIALYFDDGAVTNITSRGDYGAESALIIANGELAEILPPVPLLTVAQAREMFLDIEPDVRSTSTTPFGAVSIVREDGEAVPVDPDIRVNGNETTFIFPPNVLRSGDRISVQNWPWPNTWEAP